MDPHISAVLVLVLVSAGTETSRACSDPEHKHGSSQLSHFCYECTGLNYCMNTMAICPSGFSKCMSSTIVLGKGGTTLKIKKKECIDECQNGSFNYGISKTAYSCCDSDFCNARDAPDPRLNTPNGRTCYYCDGQSCSNTVSCSGTEDACITTTVTHGGHQMLVKGCITKSICGLLKCSFIQDLSCCEGNLCNGDKSDTQAVTPGFIYDGLNQSVTQSLIQSFTYHSAKSATRRVPYNGEESATRRIPYNGEESATRRIPYNGEESDTHSSSMHKAAKSDTQRMTYNGAKSVTHSFLFSALLLPAALILQ
ncbi:uncharacterized protein [Chanodichthys erythropterus]|uniref:uncharacterized protein n=1 Tax=Chanodichthys erythropterus TaxID=933992 RepID=UPI00351F31FF